LNEVHVLEKTEVNSNKSLWILFYLLNGICQDYFL